MSHNFLLEIGLEEIPARLVTASSQQFKTKTADFLADQRLSYESIEAFSTPRRLGIRINNLASKQEDIEEVAKGPAKKIALDDEGNWSKAAQGFARGQGVSPDDIFFKEIKGVEYVHVNKFIPGKTAAEILPGMIEVVKSLNFPVSMHWGSYDFKYIRPIHWLVALLDDEVIPMELLDVKSDRLSRGHRFLGAEAVIDSALNYETKLADQFVIAEAAKRESLIVAQISEIEKANNWVIELDEDLLDEVNNLVEYPTAFVGNFGENYLAIPSEVLITSMKEHQRYFDVKDQAGNLLPHFVAVRNGNAEHLENVARGNEKVLTARLEDAEFFYQEDQKLTIAEAVEQLKNVTFHEKIGSIYEKMARVQTIAQLLGKEVKLSATEMQDLERASEIYKFDLMTAMVGEFPELQGIMGEKYALMQGETPAVAQAIREHYLPISSEGDLPASNVGAVLAVADKVDTVISFFNAEMIPTGSNDPYALRRQTYGIIRIVVNMGWDFPLLRLQKEIAHLINKDQGRFGIKLAETQKEVTDFMKGRMKQFLGTKGIRHDIIEAVTSEAQNDLAKMVEAADVIKAHHGAENYKPAVEALTRVLNLSKKELGEEQTTGIQPNLFENDGERNLYAAVEEITAKSGERTLEENYQALTDLAPLIEAYFEETMVMVEDEDLRGNRLQQLKKIASLVRGIASLDLLIVKQTTENERK